MAVALLLVSGGLAGCALFGKGEAKPAAVTVTVTGANRLNPDEAGSSLPTQIRVYLLKSAAKAEVAEFTDLYQRDKEILGESLVLVDQFVLSPGETATRKLTPEKEAGAVLVMGLFRKPSAMAWRVVAILPPGKDAKLAFTASDYRIERR